MTLTRSINDARRQTATLANRRRQLAAEKRLDEIVSVASIADGYEQIDRAGDLQMESHFGKLYQQAPTDEYRELVVQAFTCWQRTERLEESQVRGDTDGAVLTLKVNNDFWLGAAVPTGSDGAA